MGVFDYFIGTSQSKYAAIAMFSAILVICLAILFTVTDIPVGNRIGLVLFVILMSIFPVLISLFELTCIVTGGKNNKYNLCNIFAWFVTIVVVVYCFILIITTLISMFTYKKAIHKITITENFNKISSEDANTIAKNILNEEDEQKQQTQPNVPQKMMDKEMERPINNGLPSPSEMVNMTMPSLSSVMNNVFSNQESFENEVTGFDESSNYMDLGDVKPTIQEVPQPQKRNVEVNQVKDVEPFSDTIENFYSI